MTKIKLKDAAAKLIENSGSILKLAVKTRNSADSIASAFDQIEKGYIKAENERLEQERLIENKALESKHMTSFTMADEEPAKEIKEEKKKATETAVEPIKVAEQKVEAPVVEPKEVPTSKETVVEQVEEKAVEKKSQKPVVEQKDKAAPTATYRNQQQRPYQNRDNFNQNRQGQTTDRRYQDNNRTPYRDRNAQDGQNQGYQRRPYTPNAQGGQGYQAGQGYQGGQNQGYPRRPYNQGGQSSQGQTGTYNRGYVASKDGAPSPFKRPDRPFNKAPRTPFMPDKDDDDDTNNRQRQSKARTASRPKTPDIVPIVEKERVSNYDPKKKSYERRASDYDNAKKKKGKIRTNNIVESDDDFVRGGRRGGKKKMSAQQLMDPILIENAVMTNETITVRDLSSKIGKQANEILKQLLILGIMANINSELDFDTASIVAGELGISLDLKLEKTAEERLIDIDVEDDEASLVERPPVITIMGHVDHGKTSLLDYIRKSHVTSGEAGGITQHIGAYMVNVKGRPITFLDTPGHEAFTSMRARGAQATDIAIIVVAANDGVMPQTIEAINHAKAADVPIIIAINKMDVEGANPERVKQDLTNYELVAEEWGGDTIMVPISALKGQGIDQLLEMVLLVADMQQYKANPNRSAKGVIIEAKLDKSRGPLATVLLKTGTLKVGDSIVAGTASGNVRAMQNDKGEIVESAGPSMPVEISGFDEVPAAGDEMVVVDDNRLSRVVVAERKDKEKAERQSSGSKISLDNLFSQIDQGKLVKLNLIIKADVQGSVEAVKQAMEKLSNDEVKVRVLHSAVGAVTNDDVNLASAFNAIIIGFNIIPNAAAKEMAAKEGVDIRLYRVIYKAIEDMEKAMKGMLEPEYKEVVLGHAEVRSTFRITGTGTVAGCYVTDGKMQRKESVRLLRDSIIVFEGKLSSLRRFKDDAKEVAANYECGISLDGFNDIKVNDIIECFTLEEIEK